MPISRTNPGSSPNQSGRLSSMATTFQISNTYKERANALFLMHILMHTSSRSHGAPCVHMQMHAFSRPPLRPTTEPEAQTRSYVFRRARRTFLPAEQRIFCHRSAARGPARKLNPSIGAASAAPYGDEVAGAMALISKETQKRRNAGMWRCKPQET